MWSLSYLKKKMLKETQKRRVKIKVYQILKQRKILLSRLKKDSNQKDR